MVGDCERVTVAAIAELELALEVGAPKRVGRLLRTYLKIADGRRSSISVR